MELDKKYLHIVAAFLISAVISVVFVVFATIAGELYSPLKNWFKDINGHHWTGKSVFSAGIFFGFGLIFSLFIKTESEENLSGLLRLLIIVTILGALAITGFFAYEAFGHHG